MRQQLQVFVHVHVNLIYHVYVQHVHTNVDMYHLFKGLQKLYTCGSLEAKKKPHFR